LKQIKATLFGFILHAIIKSQDGNTFFSGGGDGGGSGGDGGDGGGSGGDGGDGGGGAGGDGGAGGAGGDGGNSGDINYPTDLDASYHGNETILNHYDKDKKEFKLGSLMKALVHNKSAIGKDKMIVPNDNFTDDQWKETFTKLGLPGHIDKYDVKNNLPEGVQANEALFNGLKEIAYGAGVLPAQAQKISDFLNTKMGEQAKQANFQAQSLSKQGQRDLELEYGNAFDRKMVVAEQGLGTFADEDTVKHFQERGYMDDPKFVKMLVGLGEALGEEDKFNDDIRRKMGSTPEEIESEINSFFEPTHPYKIGPSHPQYNHYEKRYLELQTMKLKAGGRENKVLVG